MNLLRAQLLSTKSTSSEQPNTHGVDAIATDNGISFASTSSRTYTFKYQRVCNMCKSGPEYQVLFGRRLDSPQRWWPRRKPGITVSVFKCRRCGLIYPNPLPLPQTVEEHYNVAPREYWHDEYFADDPDYLGQQIKTFIRLTGSDPDRCTALDVGAGIGKGIRALKRAGFTTSGIEPSEEFCRAAIQANRLSSSELICTSVEDALFSNSAFDFINMGAVLEHLADPAVVVEKALTWLKPDGVMQIEVPSSAFLLSRLVRRFYKLTGNDFVINTCPMHVPYHLYEFGLDSFKNHGALAGYELIFYEYFSCAGYMPAALKPVFNGVMNWTRTGMQLSVWLRKDHGVRSPSKGAKK